MAKTKSPLIQQVPKVGIIVESGRTGLEFVLCQRICVLLRQHFNVNFDLDILPMDNKRNLIQRCGPATLRLFTTGCTHVVILWDERPAWPDMNEPLCWHRDRTDILANLHQTGLRNQPIHLVCIEREFESWLLFDHKMLSSMFSTNEHKVNIKTQGTPDNIPNPKGKMGNLYKQHGRGRKYSDVQCAPHFAKNLTDLTGLLRCLTFRRFAEKVLGHPI